MIPSRNKCFETTLEISSLPGIESELAYHLIDEKMRNEINDDNIYKEGTVICAKADPEVKLIILKYRQRIYYCASVESPEQNNFAYFEKELIPPIESDQQVQYRPVDQSTSASKEYIFKSG